MASNPIQSNRAWMMELPNDGSRMHQEIKYKNSEANQYIEINCCFADGRIHDSKQFNLCIILSREAIYR